MTTHEVCALFGKSRRQIMRYVKKGIIPPPSEEEPRSWDAKAIMEAYRRWLKEDK